MCVRAREHATITREEYLKCVGVLMKSVYVCSCWRACVLIKSSVCVCVCVCVYVLMLAFDSERFMAWMAEEGFDHAQVPLPSTSSRCPDAAHKCVEMHSFVRK